MTKSSNKFRKPCFWPFLDPFFQFWGQKNFSRKSGFATHNFIWVSSPMPKFRKINDTIPRKCPDRRKDGRTDRPYFIGPFCPKPEIQKLQIMFNLITNVVKCFFFIIWFQKFRCLVTLWVFLGTFSGPFKRCQNTSEFSRTKRILFLS